MIWELSLDEYEIEEGLKYSFKVSSSKRVLATFATNWSLLHPEILTAMIFL